MAQGFWFIAVSKERRGPINPEHRRMWPTSWSRCNGWPEMVGRGHLRGAARPQVHYRPRITVPPSELRWFLLWGLSDQPGSTLGMTTGQCRAKARRASGQPKKTKDEKDDDDGTDDPYYIVHDVLHFIGWPHARNGRHAGCGAFVTILQMQRPALRSQGRAPANRRPATLYWSRARRISRSTSAPSRISSRASRVSFITAVTVCWLR